MKTKQFFAAFILCLSPLVLSSCHDDDDTNGGLVEGQIVTKGLLVLNEGSYFSNINGSLDYWDAATGTLTSNAFETVNGRSLGGTPNHAITVGDKLYIASTDENRIEVVDLKTLRAGTPISISQPRELCAMSGHLYATSYTGKVTKIKISTGEIVATSEVIGTNLEGIAATNGSLYVCNAWNSDYTYNTNVIKLNPQTLAKQKDITVNANPNQVIAIGSNVYVCSWGNYADAGELVQKIDASDNVTDIAPATYMTVCQDKLYLVSSPYYMPSYKVYDTRTATLSDLAVGNEVFQPTQIAADPQTSDIFIASLSKDPDTGYGSYTLPGYVVRYKADGTLIGQFPTSATSPGTLIYINY